MQLFIADTTIFFKEISPENIKKCSQKFLIIGAELFFQYWPGCPNDPKTELPYHQKPLDAGLGIYYLHLGVNPVR